jgi:hypothetical protein
MPAMRQISVEVAMIIIVDDAENATYPIGLRQHEGTFHCTHARLQCTSLLFESCSTSAWVAEEN